MRPCWPPTENIAEIMSQLKSSFPPPSARIAVAMSGGVDSSVAAALLVDQGYQVVGVHMKLHDLPSEERRDKSCCSIDDSLDARQACARLGIPFYVLDFTERFQSSVIDYFIDGYRAGETPNPCVMCNRKVKNSVLLDRVREFGCDFLATGHYARIRHSAKGAEGDGSGNGAWELARPRDRHKDQTYFLFGTPREELPHLLFPLADLDKTQTRAVAEKRRFFTWNKPDSQEVCFVPSDYRKFLRERMEPVLPGNFVDRSGKVLGTHGGIPFYTVGQRRGLGLSAPEPLYVVALRPQSNEVVLGAEPELFSRGMRVGGANWVSRPPITAPIEAEVKIRYSHQGARARIVPEKQPGGEDTLRVEFETPVRAIAPGQAAVFYQGDVLLGGGWILPVENI